MSDTLYLQLDQNIQVNHPHVYLQDIAALSMSNQKLLNRLRVLPVATLDEKKPGRYVMSVSDLLKMIQKAEPSVDISPLGETDFIITYQTPSVTSELFRKVKIFFVCLASFFGAAFSIMTFNNDVDLGNIFNEFYTLVTGKASSGFTILEISYSVGIGVGILFFFNHFGQMKLTDDPTPMQVQMRNYEDDVNKTLIEKAGQKKPD
nr:stage V sporulation protein AA [uncultured Blautia sp.]